MTEAGRRWRAWLRAGAAAPPELPPAGLAPPEPVDWRRGVMTLGCFFTCWLFGGLLLFSKGTTDGVGSWAPGARGGGPGAQRGARAPAGGRRGGAADGAVPARRLLGRGRGARRRRRVPAAARGAGGGRGGARAPRLRLNAFDERVPVRGAVRHADAARARS